MDWGDREADRDDSKGMLRPWSGREPSHLPPPSHLPVTGAVTGPASARAPHPPGTPRRGGPARPGTTPGGRRAGVMVSNDAFAAPPPASPPRGPLQRQLEAAYGGAASSPAPAVAPFTTQLHVSPPRPADLQRAVLLDGHVSRSVTPLPFRLSSTCMDMDMSWPCTCPLSPKAPSTLPTPPSNHDQVLSAEELERLRGVTATPVSPATLLERVADGHALTADELRSLRRAASNARNWGKLRGAALSCALAGFHSAESSPRSVVPSSPRTPPSPAAKPSPRPRAASPPASVMMISGGLGASNEMHAPIVPRAGAMAARGLKSRGQGYGRSKPEATARRAASQRPVGAPALPGRAGYYRQRGKHAFGA